MSKDNVAVPKVATFAIADLIAADYNPRTISDKALAGLTKSIERFGCVEPIVVNVRGRRKQVVGGHQRLKALTALGHATVLCVTVSCTDAEEQLFNVTLNNLAIQGEFRDQLEGMIAALQKSVGDETLFDLRISELREAIEETAQNEPNEATIPERQYGIFVECDDEATQQTVYERLETEGYKCLLLTL